MFGLFRKRKQLSVEEEAARRVTAIELEYLRSLIPAPVPPPPQTEAERQMEIYFTAKNDILRFNMSRCSGVLDEGNEFGG